MPAAINFWKRRKLEKKCIAQFLTFKNEIQCKDLLNKKALGSSDDIREYVGHVGIFTGDFQYANMSELTWFCRSDGNIWAEWYISVPHKSKLWYELARHYELNNRGFDLGLPMSPHSKNVVNKFTHELWTMHKLGSNTLL